MVERTRLRREKSIGFTKHCRERGRREGRERQFLPMQMLFFCMPVYPVLSPSLFTLPNFVRSAAFPIHYQVFSFVRKRDGGVKAADGTGQAARTYWRRPAKKVERRRTMWTARGTVSSAYSCLLSDSGSSTGSLLLLSLLFSTGLCCMRMQPSDAVVAGPPTTTTTTAPSSSTTTQPELGQFQQPPSQR